jgi:isopentenyl diphosphate isomerase/L-lactate dehydrogenase-like FMN-dependent dehydrogenase
MPIFLSPAAMQRLYHPDGDKASARAAEKFNTIYSMSTMANFTIEEVQIYQVVQNYFSFMFIKIDQLQMI